MGYIKAMDAWCGACVLFLFAGITEVMVLHLLRYYQYEENANTFHQMVSACTM